MTPERFWQTTPAELIALVNGYAWRQQREREQAAWMVANIVNVWLPRSNKVSIDELLGHKREQSLADKEARFVILRDKLNKRAAEGGGVA